MCWVCAERVGRAAAAALVLLLVACGGPEPSPEQQLTARIDALEAAVEAGDLRQAASFVATAYADDQHRNKAAAMASLAYHRRRHGEVHLFTLVKGVTVTPDTQRASSVVYIAMTGTPADSVETLVALNADLYRFEIDWVAQDGGWQVARAQWRRARLSDL